MTCGTPWARTLFTSKAQSPLQTDGIYLVQLSLAPDGHCKLWGPARVLVTHFGMMSMMIVVAPRKQSRRTRKVLSVRSNCTFQVPGHVSLRARYPDLQSSRVACVVYQKKTDLACCNKGIVPPGVSSVAVVY